MNKTDFEYDLIVNAKRVVCPATAMDGLGSVAVCGGRIVACGADITGSARKTLDFPEATLLPGLIDLHAHPAVEGSKYGVDPDVHFLPRGVTTVLSQGDAGASNLQAYLERTVKASRTRVKLAIHLSAPGESMPGGCFENLDWVDVDACVAAINEGGDDIWGIAVNASRIACGENDPGEINRRAFEAAARTRKPLLYGIADVGVLPLEQQMELLRPGDVVTYCFQNLFWTIAPGGKIHPSVREARQRGVLFDVGHGMQSFDFPNAEACIADGFGPDTISTDQYQRHVDSNPQHDLPRTMSKLSAAGMSQADVFAAVTVRPAEILGMAGEIGTLAVGACADLTVLAFNDDAAPLVDTAGNERPGGCWEAVCAVRAGEVV